MTTVYLDSSAVVRIVEGNRKAVVLLRGATKLVASQLTALEVQRVLIRMATLKEISDEKLERLSKRFDVLLEHIELHSIDAVVSRASERFPLEPVRSLDAVHLATIARLAREERGRLAVCTFDRRMHANGELMGCDVLPANLPVRRA